MLRIRETTPGTYEVTVSYTATCPVEELDSCIAGVKGYIGSSLGSLAINANNFDEVRIDNNGSLHCKNVAAEEAEEPEDDDNES